MRAQFGKTIVQLAIKDPNIVLMTGDVEQSMTEYKHWFPDRFFNFGLCEQSIVSLAAGMALGGMRPVVYSITPFLLERAFEQIKIDVDENNLPVMFIGYDDYPTHGITHRALNAQKTIELFKNVQGFFPRNSIETEKYMLEAYLMNKPTFICLKKDGKPIM